MMKYISTLTKNPMLFFKYLLRVKKLAALLDIGKDEIRNYLKEADQITKQISVLTGNMELGTMLSPLRGPIVYVCVRALKPVIMVETGVASGASTCYILHAMEKNKKGLLYSIDQPNVDQGASLPKGKDVGWLVPQDLRQRWRLILGWSQEKLPPLLKALGNIDAFLHDSEHTYETMMFEYVTAYSYLKIGGILISDDVHRNQAFHDFVRKSNPRRWMIFDGLGAAVK